MTKTRLPGTRVFRSALTNGAQFEEYVNAIGRPLFAVSCGGDDPGEARAALDEWFFADDIESLMEAFLDWDARGIRMELAQLAADEADIADIRAAWSVVGLPAHFNDAASSLTSRSLGVMCKAMGAEGARRAFLESVFNDAWMYDFVALRATRYDSFIEEWKSDDDKNSRPDHYRAQKHFGVVADAGELGVDSRSLQYWVYIGVASGSLTAQQLTDAGLTCKGLIGQACVINGLGEVERIGNILIPRAGA